MRFFLLALLGCGGGAEPAAPPGFGAERETQLRRYKVDLKLVPDPPVMNELFRAEVGVRAKDGGVIEDAKVLLNARMPQHGHGMETDPVNDPGVCGEGGCKHPGGRYGAEGFRFHMPGEWTVTVEIDGPEGADSTSFVYDLSPKR